MKLLLDTHTFIWYVTNNSKFSSTAKLLINDGNNEVVLSKASVWEMAIKHSIRKLTFDTPFDIFIKRQLSLNNIELLDIKTNHLIAVATLPPHHGDPFDRLIIVQAMLEDLPIIGSDVAFDAYEVRRLW
ncbi:putative PilT protein [Calothrix sp. NIES-4071]|nr:putative PilT protein [Calothrix sp. NIES-4071]BAZ58835.1 putative PilT protein [Calothrix sp. NIES-4105]